MRRLLCLVTLLLPAIASAQPGVVEPLAPGGSPSLEVIAPTTDPQLLSLARAAHEAAVRGDCVGARGFGGQIAQRDPAFHRAVIKTDSEITYCRPAAREYSIAVADEASEPAREGRPPIEGTTLVGELLVGGLFSIAGAVAGGYLGYGIAESSNCSGGCDEGGLVIGGFLGGTLMAAVGVNLMGDSDEVDGSFGYAVGGSVLGGLAGIGLVANGEYESGTAFVIVLAGPSLGAILGHTMSLSYKPRRARPASPSYDRRLAVQPSQRIGDGAALTIASGSF